MLTWFIMTFYWFPITIAKVQGIYGLQIIFQLWIEWLMENHAISVEQQDIVAIRPEESYYCSLICRFSALLSCSNKTGITWDMPVKFPSGIMIVISKRKPSNIKCGKVLYRLPQGPAKACDQCLHLHLQPPKFGWHLGNTPAETDTCQIL